MTIFLQTGPSTCSASSPSGTGQFYECQFTLLFPTNWRLNYQSITEFSEAWILADGRLQAVLLALHGLRGFLKVSQHLSELLLHVSELVVDVALYPLILFTEH